MGRSSDRREFLKFAGLGGAVFASGLTGRAGLGASKQDDFYFVQLSDTHWSFRGPALNPDTEGTLHKAVAAVNALALEPLARGGMSLWLVSDLNRTELGDFARLLAGHAAVP
jgi:hypothetical protein